MAKKIKREVKRVSDTSLVDFVIEQIPNLFDAVPRGSVSRPAVEKFLKELKDRG